MKRKPAPEQDNCLSEAGIISAITARFAKPDSRVQVGPGDDAAVLRSGEVADSARRLNAMDQVVTTDLLVEGVHFDLRYMSLVDAGYKALAVNLSDIAAMGGRPVHVFGNLGVPPGTAERQVSELLDGVAAALPAGVVLAGGDTVAAPQWIIGFTVIGEIRGPALLRSGAAAGDLIWHSGGLGLSQAGLNLLWSGEDTNVEDCEVALAAHRRPVAQLALARFLHENKLATSCIDLSDSLAQCLLLLADASDVGLTLDFSNYPFAPGVLAFRRKLRRWRAGGRHAFSVPARFNPAAAPARFRSMAEFLLASAEDFQLLFTAHPAATARLLGDSPVPLCRIGTVVDPAEGCHYCAEDGRTLKLTRIGFDHLQP